jgi:putative sterol carrier protein
MPTAAELMGGLEERVRSRSDRAAGLSAIYQYRLTGDGGGNWVLQLVDGQPSVREGEAEQPDVTVTMRASDYVDMATGKLDGGQAFMTGKMRVSGDTALGMRLQDLTG